jgi:hypothetical protein
MRCPGDAVPLLEGEDGYVVPKHDPEAVAGLPVEVVVEWAQQVRRYRGEGAEHFVVTSSVSGGVDVSRLDLDGMHSLDRGGGDRGEDPIGQGRRRRGRDVGRLAETRRVLEAVEEFTRVRSQVCIPLRRWPVG